MVVGPEEAGGDDDVVDAVVGEGLDARGIHRAIKDDGLGLLREHHGHAEMMRHHGGDADARGLDGEDLVNGLAREQPLPFLGHLGEQLNVHLVVQEGVHLQHTARLHHAIAANALFQQFHGNLLGLRGHFRVSHYLRRSRPSWERLPKTPIEKDVTANWLLAQLGKCAFLNRDLTWYFLSFTRSKWVFSKNKKAHFPS